MAFFRTSLTLVTSLFMKPAAAARAVPPKTRMMGAGLNSRVGLEPSTIMEAKMATRAPPTAIGVIRSIFFMAPRPPIRMVPAPSPSRRRPADDPQAGRAGPGGMVGHVHGQSEQRGPEDPDLVGDLVDALLDHVAVAIGHGHHRVGVLFDPLDQVRVDGERSPLWKRVSEIIGPSSCSRKSVPAPVGTGSGRG